MELLDRDTLLLQCLQDSIHDLRLLVQAVGAIAEGTIRRDILTLLLTCEIKLVFSRSFKAHTSCRQTRNHAFEKATRISPPGRPVQTNLIAEHTGGIGYIW